MSLMIGNPNFWIARELRRLRVEASLPCFAALPCFDCKLTCGNQSIDLQPLRLCLSLGILGSEHTDTSSGMQGVCSLGFRRSMMAMCFS